MYYFCKFDDDRMSYNFDIRFVIKKVIKFWMFILMLVNVEVGVQYNYF